MSRTKKEFYSTVLGDKANQSVNERLRVVSAVGIYVQNFDAASHNGTAKVFKTLSDDLRLTLKPRHHNVPSNT